MIGYRDKTFCSAACATADCHRQFTDEERVRAERWWGGPDAPIAFSNFSGDCQQFAPLTEARALASTPASEGGDE